MWCGDTCTLRRHVFERRAAAKREVSRASRRASAVRKKVQRDSQCQCVLRIALASASVYVPVYLFVSAVSVSVLVLSLGSSVRL